MKKKQYGKCKLCGNFTKLTFEHVPPKSAFNDTPVKIVSGEDAISTLGDDRLPWDFSDLHGRTQQRGKGGYYLCKSCNSITGAWYQICFPKSIQ